MKIIRVVTRMNIGGPSLHVALLSNDLDPARFSTTLVVGQTQPGEGSRLPWAAAGPARLRRIRALRRPLNPWLDLAAFLRIGRAIWSERPQIVHTHMAKAGALGRLAGLLYNRVGPGRQPGQRAILVHTFHGHVLEGYFSRWVSRLFGSIERWLARRTDCLIGVSATVRDALLARGIGTPKQWRVVRLGIDCSELKELPFPNGSVPLRCGLVGRLVPVKNPALFLQALERIRSDHPSLLVRGRIIGDGPLRPGLEEIGRRRGLEEIVTFVGWRDNPKACYEDLDAVCVTSRNEGTPLSLVEAMAAGRAVVSTAVGGVPDLLGLEEREGITPPPDVSGEAGPAFGGRPFGPTAGGGVIPPGGFAVAARGLLIREGDACGLAAALVALARDPALRRRLGEAGRSYATEQHSAARLLREISELYEQLTGDTMTIVSPDKTCAR